MARHRVDRCAIAAFWIGGIFSEKDQVTGDQGAKRRDESSGSAMVEEREHPGARWYACPKLGMHDAILAWKVGTRDAKSIIAAT